MKVYSGVEQLRPFFDSFNYLYDLALDGDYSPWYSKGYWDESLIPFFIVKDDIVVANVSVAPMQLVLNNSNITILQISTVMTHPEYRLQGLLLILCNMLWISIKDNMSLCIYSLMKVYLIFIQNLDLKESMRVAIN